MLACFNPTGIKGQKVDLWGRYISVSVIVKGKRRTNVHTGSMGKKVHEDIQQIIGDYLYLRSTKGNNTDEQKFCPQMLKMKR
jgi:hypothetical protein